MRRTKTVGRKSKVNVKGVENKMESTETRYSRIDSALYISIAKCKLKTLAVLAKIYAAYERKTYAVSNTHPSGACNFYLRIYRVHKENIPHLR